jgi:YbbR domain-containing protein
VRRWWWDNFESLLFAFLLALSVWMAGVSATDPIEEREFPSSIPIVYTDPAEGLLLVGDPPSEGRVTLRAPSSVWQSLTASDLELQADLSQLVEGTHPVALSASVAPTGVRVMRVDPETIQITLEAATRRTVPLRPLVVGEPAARYRAGTPQVTPDEVTVVGPASVVDKVIEAVAPVDLTGADQDFDASVDLVARDASGEIASGVVLDPPSARVQIEVALPGGFRSVAVLPLLTDQVAPGYRVTNVSVTPPTVVVFSGNPAAVESLPGYVRTGPISLAGAKESIQQRAAVDLPQGVSLVDEQAVLIDVTVEPILSSINLTRPVEIVGLVGGLYALAAPDVVSVILDGPLPVLERLQPEDVRVVLDLLGLGVGRHAVETEVIVLPEGVTVRTVLPQSIEVTISRTPFATPTPIP